MAVKGALTMTTDIDEEDEEDEDIEDPDDYEPPDPEGFEDNWESIFDPLDIKLDDYHILTEARSEIVDVYNSDEDLNIAGIFKHKSLELYSFVHVELSPEYQWYNDQDEPTGLWTMDDVFVEHTKSLELLVRNISSDKNLSIQTIQMLRDKCTDTYSDLKKYLNDLVLLNTLADKESRISH